jgi:RNA polymerase sigma-70 factor, ECF subfamily
MPSDGTTSQSAGETMSSVGSLTYCVQLLRCADERERDDAARVIWERFSCRLQALVRRHLDNRIRRREDEEDILQSMYASFCAGQLEGKAPPSGRDQLWKLLVRITMCKLVNTANRHRAARRDVRREHGNHAGDSDSETHFPRWMLEHVDRSAPSPEERVLVVEELDRLLQDLPDELRQIVVWKLEGFTNAEIAATLDRTVRCIELKMQLIRKRLQASLPQSARKPAANSEPPGGLKASGSGCK